MINILAISGSLRAKSTNTRLVERLADIAGAEFSIDIYSDLDRLSHFNPDEEPSEDIFVRDLTQRTDGATGRLKPRWGNNYRQIAEKKIG